MSENHESENQGPENRSLEEIEQSIEALLGEAERVARAETRMHADNFGQTPAAEMSSQADETEIKHYLDGLDVLISEEATMALRAEFLRFSSVFDTDKTRETIQQAIQDVTKPLIEAWIEKHMPDIARSVVSEAIGKIAEVGKNRG